jgi:hypothetical protein
LSIIDCLPSASSSMPRSRRRSTASPDLVVLAGFMRILGGFRAPLRERLINIHPSLLPAFPACTRTPRAGRGGPDSWLHGTLRDPDLDHGPVIVQAAVPVLDDDDEATLAARVLAQEHQVYPLAVRWFAEGRLRLHDGRVRWMRRRMAGVLIAPQLVALCRQPMPVVLIIAFACLARRLHALSLFGPEIDLSTCRAAAAVGRTEAAASGLCRPPPRRRNPERPAAAAKAASGAAQAGGAAPGGPERSCSAETPTPAPGSAASPTKGRLLQGAEAIAEPDLLPAVPSPLARRRRWLSSLPARGRIRYRVDRGDQGFQIGFSTTIGKSSTASTGSPR